VNTDAVPERDTAAMTLIEHLRELRVRTTHAVVAAVIGVIVGWVFHEQVFTWLIDPYNAAMTLYHPDLPNTVSFRGIEEPFVVYLKTSVIGGMLVSMPYILLQVWLFVGPGLHDNEKKLVAPFSLATMVCFLGGAAFCRYLVLEPAVGVLISIGGEGTSPNIMMNEYFTFTTRLLLAFGMLFEMPVMITFLSLIGVVSSSFLLKQWRYAVVLAFIAGGALTPPDPLSQAMLAVPLLVLYFVSIGIAVLIERARGPKVAEPSPDDSGDAE
jgi:sec-independent protein translocase protein TatC